MGRKFENYIRFRISTKEKQNLKKEAEKRGISMSRLLRSRFVQDLDNL
jgi:hypothetical protein